MILTSFSSQATAEEVLKSLASAGTEQRFVTAKTDVKGTLITTAVGAQVTVTMAFTAAQMESASDSKRMENIELLMTPVTKIPYVTTQIPLMTLEPVLRSLLKMKESLFSLNTMMCQSDRRIWRSSAELGWSIEQLVIEQPSSHPPTRVRNAPLMMTAQLLMIMSKLPENVAITQMEKSTVTSKQVMMSG